MVMEKRGRPSSRRRIELLLTTRPLAIQ
jgi:hypothetical protein